ncbi:hypothetical protein BO79DRAFT_227650 [Aspergillus costaricaensis CBS 115574]|uniref:Uncharacterized protein n=1 Tax=Aspergillus costaricaensis CBS 115574 TaxID=1448317 RepID=A0ACD1IFV8_9EURO|nr:hypothetical protein BO79DRAFT_227650 [Aspergillus costaricaensis CBS 115574]RAK89441.1 hypothetical protein BO79DRAFT_227650 [Aspergillus costaricaensis CBS 115574]
MPIIDWISRLFPRYSREKRLSNLELLPRELLLHIGNLLTTADIICLSLCSRTLNIFATSFYDFKLPQDKSLTLLVLTRLTRDLPKMFCCHYCAKLHRITDVLHPARSMGFRHRCPDLGVWHRKCPQPSIRWLLSVHCMTTLYDFRHCHLVAVLQNYHSGGRCGINAESLAFTEVVDYPQQPARTTLLSVEGRVCTPAGARQRPSLVLQIQQWVLIHDLQVFSDRGLDVALSVLHNWFICNWLRVGHGSIQDKIRPANRQRNLCWKEAPLTEIMRCSHCGVEFQIVLRACGEDGTAVTITKWLDLGAGTDIEDPKWKKATFTNTIESIYDRVEATASTGEVRRLFRESSDQESDPTPRNRSPSWERTSTSVRVQAFNIMGSADIISILGTLGTWVGAFRPDLEILVRYIVRQFTPTSHSSQERIVEALDLCRELLLLQQQEISGLNAHLDDVCRLLEAMRTDLSELKARQFPTRT